jgi:hypothetical protein
MGERANETTPIIRNGRAIMDDLWNLMTTIDHRPEKAVRPEYPLCV